MSGRKSKVYAINKKVYKVFRVDYDNVFTSTDHDRTKNRYLSDELRIYNFKPGENRCHPRGDNNFSFEFYVFLHKRDAVREAIEYNHDIECRQASLTSKRNTETIRKRFEIMVFPLAAVLECVIPAGTTVTTNPNHLAGEDEWYGAITTPVLILPNFGSAKDLIERQRLINNTINKIESLYTDLSFDGLRI
jgi:hypothetical protein